MKTTVPESFQAYPEFLWNQNNTVIVQATVKEPFFSISWEYALLFGGMLVATLFFGYKLYQIYVLKRKGKVLFYKDFTQIIISNSSIAFSFFKSIFLGDQVIAKDHKSILQHELVHIRQRHSYDLIFFELMRIVGWFNPLVYVYQRRVSELHEFIADAQVAKTNKKEHYQQLLSEVFQTQHISFINQFFKSSLIKKRIVMLQKSQSKKIFQLKYLLLLPLVFGMLAYTSFESTINNNGEQEQTTEDIKLIEELKLEISEEVAEMGSLSKVLYSFERSNENEGEAYILKKREYFKKQILFEMFFEDMDPVKFGDDVETQKQFPEKPLPSTISYDSYVQYTKAFQILDDNLKISISKNIQNEGLDLKLLNVNESFPDVYEIYEVENVKDLTGNEVREFNMKIDEIFGDESSKKSRLIFTDGQYTFEIFKAAPFNLETENQNSFLEGKNEPPKEKVEVIKVKDIENLTLKEENKIFKRLKSISENSTSWELYVKDKNSTMKFVRANDGSYLSGPNGEKFGAKLIYDTTLSEESKLSITEFLKKNGTTNLTVQTTTNLYDQLIRDRKRLMQTTNEKNPIIVNLDAQLENLKMVLSLEIQTIAFAEVDKVPVFPGCENEGDKRACFQKSIQKHISKNFRYPQEAQERGIQGRVSVLFTMNAVGDIANVRLRGPDKLLEAEAGRIISLLPKVKPGVHEGKKVGVAYAIPITFRLRKQPDEFQFVNEDGEAFSDYQKPAVKQYNELLKERNRLLENTDEGNAVIVIVDEQLTVLRNAIYQNDFNVPFTLVEEVPIFPGCEGEDNKRECFSKMMQKHISKNFNYPLEAQEKGIQGRVSIMFTISTDGTIQNVRMRGPDALLEEESARIISKLPKMTPGKQKGKAVNVPFSIPISFKLKGESNNNRPLSFRNSEEESKSILIFVDGVESTYEAMRKIHPDDIATINVFKDEAATDKYGEKGNNGVIEVILKNKD